ncbi:MULTISPECIES: DUF11 domain-containing protein [Streptomyces]|uniref:DUF11 domain-containing protein n=1 Tax=Streptomyces TaxID=1883 RepID=UPI0006945EBA|nr:MULTISPECIES: DUF11 domain-containing protein [Streptomyces]MCH0558143.1 DUF11 domain-containing protein [Streptomyces sp. MUM 16J]
MKDAPERSDLIVVTDARPTSWAPRGGDEPGTTAVRGTFDYVVKVTNHGPSDARGVTVVDHLPPALEFVSSPDGCAAQGRTVTCGVLPVLPVGSVHTWVVTVRLAPGYGGDGSDIVNEAEVGSDTADPAPENNTTSLTGLEIPPSARTADLALEKTAVLGPGRKVVRPGETFDYLIMVRNHGPVEAREVRVTDTLPRSLDLLSSPDDCMMAPGGDRLVVCPVRDRLGADETVRYRITVKVKDEPGGSPPRDRCTPIDNVARVDAMTFDPNTSDNANKPGTTGPDGGRLCLVAEEDGHHPDHGNRPPHGDGHHSDGHAGRPDGHGGRGSHGQEGGHQAELAHSGSGVPPWLMWTSAGLLAVGAVLRLATRRRV